MGKLVINILEDGSIKTDARGADGTEAEILEDLNELAALVGGELTVEKHEPGRHGHHHHHGHVHTHGSGGGHKH